MDNRAAARVTDATTCPGAAGRIQTGCATVLVENHPAARATDKVSHGGRILLGTPRVLIGSPLVDADGNPVKTPPECAYLKRLNPLDFNSPERMADMLRVEKGLGRLRSPVEMTFLGDITHTFVNGQAAAAKEYEVTVRGHHVKVIVPVNVPGGAWVPSADMVAQSLGTLSDKQLDQIQTVIVEPAPDPNSPNAIADSVNDEPEIHFFPRAEAHPQGDVDWAIMHEAAHRFEASLGADFPGVWHEIMEQDLRSPSTYGNKTEAEDFAESVLLYAMTIGTPCEATARALFPARFRLLDKLLSRSAFPVRREEFTR
jgi:hypothetical protein